MGLCLQTSKWSQSLWQSHMTHSRPARQVIAVGKKKQQAFPAWADDLHGLLYLRNAPEPVEDAPTWATDLLAQAQELAEWQPLRSRCRVNGFAAGIATETILRALVAMVPQEEAPQEPTHQPQPGRGTGTGHPAPSDPSATRRALRQAMREAGKEVDAAEAAMEGLLGGGGSGAPLARASSGSMVALDQVRQLYALLQANGLMQQMASMAGRLQRLVARQKKAQAVGQVGAITGVTIGGDLARILPSELAGLRVGRLARLQVLATIQGRKALQYEVKGDTPETRGPVIVLLDKSGSLSSTQCAWEAAFALTLLNICQEQQRVFAVLNFDHTLHDEVIVEPGAGVSPEVLQALCHQPGGDTNFERPLTRALALLTQDARLGKSDVFFLTDGKPSKGWEPSAQTLAGLQTLKDTEGLSIFGVGIGRAARLDTIRAIATETYTLHNDPRLSEGDMVPLLAAVA
jgi:von Willebrand factor type A domain